MSKKTVKQISRGVYQKLDKHDRSYLNELLFIWTNGCSDMHDDCNRCPKERKVCEDITDKLLDKIYDKMGK